ncbi:MULTISPECIES: polysaccharide biosynthesis protein [Acetobacterium]|jgi:FlaA1/EpsC-like NDP-sugar epimerase|uniref:polysaccharide biosynthesis protein n=1 Tax=Acetobacterium TaxID=33951 RepID=UPI000DBEC812|nr:MULTISPECIES: nucleoside-diphosphate sugar epimerase/dehydratase [unclassified Acetobacterium]AWW25443.1 polysaccharide biosynthesis protein [Acetobacterium sp. KB-1]MDZ5723955.1 nucleoside-diphosphate sugar epimerase/dehydratase [Acetobacterium sp. K1/6]
METKLSRQLFLIVADIVAVNAAFLLTLFLHYEGNIPSEIISIYINSVFVFTVGKLLIYRYFDLYNSLWSYASVEELLKILLAVVVANVFGIIYLIYMGERLYFGIYITSMLFEIAFVSSGRFSYRLMRSLKNRKIFMKQDLEKKILIIGSGATATLIATEIKNHASNYGQVIGFIDDDATKLNKTIAGVKVLGNNYDIGSVAHKYNVNEIIIATPTADPTTLRMIISECKRTAAKVRIVPGIREMIDGQVSLSKIRDVEIEDLLGRETVNLNIREVVSYLEGKIIMVTGGGGSIGSELCRQIARFNPGKLIILDNYENSAYEIQNELINDYEDKINLDVIIASVRDRDDVFSIIETYHPDVIFHAAAHKHVPLMERSPWEAIKNNVFGTKNIAEAAHEFGVDRLVMVSTDKAVNPTNIMGASKRICEMIIQGLARQSKTKFTAVRFGNVLGSNGSVVPLFKKQIKEGGPVTVTHKEIIRFFMTIPEAAQLVIQSGAIAKGGEIFVLDMGQPVKIFDLAVDLIKLSGLKLNEDIEIEIIGLRPGEKLYEELLMDEEGLTETRFEKIRVGKPGDIDYTKLKNSLEELRPLLNLSNKKALINRVKTIVPTYKDNSEVNHNNGDYLK